MFRCPTCIAVLADPGSRRCQVCRQHLGRRRPRVLGEEHRVGARLLPIDRALNERLHRGSFALSHGAPYVERNTWESGAVAIADAPPVENPPAATDESAASLIETAIASATGPSVSSDPLWVELEPFERVTATQHATVEAQMHAGSAVDPVHERVHFEPGPLDPDVQALVDDLYRRAREEIAGSIETDAPDMAPAAAAEAQPTRRRGWVPAALADRRRHDTDANGNGNRNDADR